MPQNQAPARRHQSAQDHVQPRGAAHELIVYQGLTMRRDDEVLGTGRPEVRVSVERLKHEGGRKPNDQAASQQDE